MDRRKLQSAALFVVLFGATLLLPPLVQLFNMPARLFGVPLEVLYLFSVWLGLIVIAGWLARRLPASPDRPGADG